MLKKRSLAVHLYSEPDAEEMLALIYGAHAPALKKLRETLKEKIEQAENGKANSEAQTRRARH